MHALGVSAVCFVPVHACVYFCVLFSNLEHNTKYSGVHALLVHCVGACGCAEAHYLGTILYI